MDRGACQAIVHRVAKSQTRLSDFTVTFHFHALEKELATHSSVLAWKIPGTAKGEGAAEDKMVGWHHQLNGHELEQALGQCSLTSASHLSHHINGNP